MHHAGLFLAGSKLPERGLIKIMQQYEQRNEDDCNEQHYENILEIYMTVAARYRLAHCRHCKLERHDVIHHLEHLGEHLDRICTAGTRDLNDQNDDRDCFAGITE